MSTRSLDEERQLVARMLAGDEVAFDAFADEYYPGLYRFAARRLQERELVREIVQNAAVKAIAKLTTYRGEAPLFTWLCAICRTEIALYFRSRSRSPQTVVLDPFRQPASASEPVAAAPAGGSRGTEGEGSILRRETTRLVHEALDRLPSRYGRALEWKYLDGLTVVEIARRLELSPKAAESLLTRARSAFRDGYHRLTESAAVPLVSAAKMEKGQVL